MKSDIEKIFGAERRSVTSVLSGSVFFLPLQLAINWPRVQEMCVCLCVGAQ